MQNNRVLESAMEYIRRGWFVFPVHSAIGNGGNQIACTCPKGFSCGDSIGKHPRTPNGFKDASTDEHLIKTWFDSKEPVNVGIATGLSNLAVLDIDTGADGLKEAMEIIPNLNQTFYVKTSRGFHFYFNKPNGVKLPPKIKEGFDLKADGGYIVAPPSVHRTGQIYFPVCTKQTLDFPEEILRWIEREKQNVKPNQNEITHSSNGNGFNSLDNFKNLSMSISKGCRNNTLASEAGFLRNRGYNQAEIFEFLTVINKTRCQPPLSEIEVERIARSISNYEPAKNFVEENQRKSLSKFIFTPLSQMLEEPEEETSFLWEDTLPCGGFSICSAKPKAGKSTIARNLAVKIINGEPFLNRATVTGKILYLCLEEKRAEVLNHFRRMGVDTSDILIHTGTTPENALEQLAVAIAEYEPVLVIIDPLSRVLRVRDFNDYGGMARGLEPFVDIARKFNCHILALHHDSKMERSGGDALLGSTALFGAVDCHIQLKKRDKGRTVSTTQRYGEDLPETVIELDKETGIITPQGDLQSFMLKQAKTAILNVFKANEELSESQIKERIEGFSQGDISKALRQLFDEKLINRKGEGKKGKPFLYSKIEL